MSSPGTPYRGKSKKKGKGEDDGKENRDGKDGKDGKDPKRKRKMPWHRSGRNIPRPESMMAYPGAERGGTWATWQSESLLLPPHTFPHALDVASYALSRGLILVQVDNLRRIWERWQRARIRGRSMRW